MEYRLRKFIVYVCNKLKIRVKGFCDEWEKREGCFFFTCYVFWVIFFLRGFVFFFGVVFYLIVILCGFFGGDYEYIWEKVIEI